MVPWRATEPLTNSRRGWASWWVCWKHHWYPWKADHYTWAKNFCCLVKRNKLCVRANTPSLQKRLYFCVCLFFQQVSPTDPSNTASSILTTFLAGTRTLGCSEVQGSDCHHLPRATSGMHKIQMWNTNVIYHYGLKFTFDFQRNPNTHF